MSEGERLSARQVRAVEALLSEPTTRGAAKAAQISEATLNRWRHEPTFEAALSRARDEAFTSGLQRLKAATGEAVEALREVLRDTESKASERLSAARTILELAFKASELLDLEARLAKLEAAGRGIL